MGRKEFLESLKVDAATQEKLSNVSKAANEAAVLGEKQKTITKMQNFERDGEEVVAVGEEAVSGEAIGVEGGIEGGIDGGEIDGGGNDGGGMGM